MTNPYRLVKEKIPDLRPALLIIETRLVLHIYLPYFPPLY